MQIAAFMQLSRAKQKDGRRETFEGVFNRIDSEGLFHPLSSLNSPTNSSVILSYGTNKTNLAAITHPLSTLPSQSVPQASKFCHMKCAPLW
jgi:hypothetical protein